MAVHGYSMLRTSLNMDYYHDLYDLATDFGVEVEAHRKFYVSASSVDLLSFFPPLLLFLLASGVASGVRLRALIADYRYRNWSWCL